MPTAADTCEIAESERVTSLFNRLSRRIVSASSGRPASQWGGPFGMAAWMPESNGMPGRLTHIVMWVPAPRSWAAARIRAAAAASWTATPTDL